MHTICHTNKKSKRLFIIILVFCIIFNVLNYELYGQNDKTEVTWSRNQPFVHKEEHWIEDSVGLICVLCDSVGEPLNSGVRAVPINKRKWKVTATYDSLTCLLFEQFCESYWIGKFKRIKASTWVQNNFHCNYEYVDKTRSGLVWIVKTYSKSGELLEWYGRILIGYYCKRYNPPKRTKYCKITPYPPQLSPPQN